MKLLKAISSMKHGVSNQNCINACPSPAPSSLSLSSFNYDEEPSDCEKGISASVLPSSDASSKSKMKWQVPFPLPERFQPVVQEALNKKSFLNKTLRSKFIETIYDMVCLFNIAPTPDERRDVCRAIISKYPFLADAGGVCETWYRQIGDKVKNEMRHEKTDPVVLARKIKSNDGLSRSPKVPAPAVDGEDEQSCQAHVAWMQKEWKKKQHNVALVNKRMELTYSFRRQMLNSGKHLLKDIKAKYPFIFARDQLKDEYNRLMADKNAADTIISNLLELAPKIIMIAEKRNVSSPEVQKFWVSVSVSQVQKVTMKLKN